MDKSKLGANTACLAGYSLHDAIAGIQSMGFRTIELLAFGGARHSQGDLAGFWFEELASAEKDQLREETRDLEHIAVHLPFQDVPVFSANPAAARLAQDQLKAGIDAAGFLGGEAATMHVHPKIAYDFSEYWQEMVDTLRRLGDHAAQYGVRLCVETMTPPTIEQFAGLIFDVGHPQVGANIDVGHVAACHDLGIPPEKRDRDEAREAFNNCLLRVADILGDKIYHFHLHDIRKDNWRDHRAAGRGVIDFPRLFTKLKQMGYQHLLSFELEEPDLLPALQESKDLIERLMEA